jgi:hypothetical protein
MERTNRRKIEDDRLRLVSNFPPDIGVDGPVSGMDKLEQLLGQQKLRLKRTDMCCQGVTIYREDHMIVRSIYLR